MASDARFVISVLYWFTLCIALLAMTKMESDVRADSLQLIDLWFEYMPELSIKHGAKMMYAWSDLDMTSST